MAKWRPEEWENPYQKTLDDLKNYNHILSQPNIIVVGDSRSVEAIIAESKRYLPIFEAGANAMLEALRKKGIAITAHDYPSYWVNFEIPNHPLGKWVFIPDDKES